MIEKIRTLWQFLRAAMKCKRQDVLLNVCNMMAESERMTMLFKKQGSDKIDMFITEERLDEDFASDCVYTIKSQIINKIGQETYERQLERFDYDMAMAFKEADYQMARADYAEAELQYFRAVNDPYGAKAPQLKKMWDNVNRTKSRLEAFEEELRQQNA